MLGEDSILREVLGKGGPPPVVVVTRIKVVTVVLASAFILAAGLPWSVSLADSPSDQAPSPWWCPWMGGGWQSSPDQRGHPMMRRHGGCPWMGRGWRTSPGEEVGLKERVPNEEAARSLIQQRIQTMNKLGLRMGSLQDLGRVYVGEIIDEQGKLVETLRIDKATGAVTSVP